MLLVWNFVFKTFWTINEPVYEKLRVCKHITFMFRIDIANTSMNTKGQYNTFALLKIQVLYGTF